MKESLRRQDEPIKSPEIWRPLFAVATFSGKEGTGKSSFTKFAAQKLEILPERVFHIGEKFKQLDPEQRGYIQRARKMDEEVDAYQTSLMLNASIEHPIIIDGRLSGILGDIIRRNNPNLPPIITALLTAPETIRTKRRLQVSLEKGLVKTKEQIRLEERNRLEKDTERYQEVHGKEIGDDPFNPTLRNKYGDPVYNTVISTVSYVITDGYRQPHDKTREEIWEEYKRSLLAKNLLQRI